MDVNDKTLKLFKGFINDLINVFPEHKDSLTNNYNSVLEFLPENTTSIHNLNIDKNNSLVKSIINYLNNYCKNKNK